jgi:hypothetical protein
MEAGRDWEGRIGTPVLADPPVPLSEDKTRADFSASTELPALCVSAPLKSLTTSNIEESGAA